MEQIIKTLTTILNNFNKSRNIFEIFRDVIEICSISEHQLIFYVGSVKKDNNYKILEERYLKIIRKYDKSDQDLIVKFYSELKLFFVKGNYGDVLGSLYMSLELGNKRNGQFFTPYTVSQFMAEITLSEVDKVIEEKGYVSISDPCVGAGGLIIAAAEIMQKRGHNLNTMIFQVIDIDELCFNMSYTQLSMLKLNGVVIWGDSLKGESFEKRKTPPLIMSLAHSDNPNLRKLIENMETVVVQDKSKVEIQSTHGQLSLL